MPEHGYPFTNGADRFYYVLYSDFCQRWLRVPLDGAELDAYLAQRDTERAAETERKRLADEAQRLKRERAELYDLEGEDAAQSSALSAHWRSHDLYWERARLEGAKHVMFPSVERRAVFDAYGEHVRVEELMRVAQEAQERQEAEEKKVPVAFQ